MIRIGDDDTRYKNFQNLINSACHEIKNRNYK